MKKTMKTPFAAAMGVALISTLSATAHAETFGANELAQGYMQLATNDKAAETACGAMMNKSGGEMSCGAMMSGMDHAKAPETKTDTKAAEASCGGMMKDGKMKKGMESSCGAMMKGKEGACGAMPENEKMKEGACGGAMKMPEGKCAAACGDNMKQCPDAKAKEGACGAKMQGCGDNMQGCMDMMKGKEGGCASSVSKKSTAVPPPVIIKPTPVQ